ncbi:MAG: membrane protein insertase YidC, partial [bacterium]
MKDSQRLIVFIALSGLILLSYNYFFMPKPGQNYSENIRPAQTEKQEKDIKKEIKNSSEDRAAINLKPVDSKITKKDARLYTVETDLVTADFSDIGAALNGYRLKKYSDTKKGDLESLELIPNKSSYTYMSLYSDSIDLTNTQWNLLQRSKTDDGVKLIFQKEIQKNVIIEKEYVLKDGTYVFDLNLRFINNTQNPFALQGLKLSWGPNIHFLPADVDKHKDGFVQYNRISYLDGDEHQKIDIKFNAKEDTTIIIPAKSRWITMKDLYFTSSFIMKELSDYKNYEAEIRTDGFAFMNVNLKDMILSPGTS